MASNPYRLAFTLALAVSLCFPNSLRAATLNLSVPSFSFDKIGSGLLGLSFSAGDWLGNLRSKIVESVNSLPKITPPPPQPQPQETVSVSFPSSPEPPALPSLNQPQTSFSGNVPSVATPPDTSVFSRILGVENQIARLRELISRQSDSNARAAASTITQVTNNIISSGAAFDVGAPHGWASLQEFANATSTLFSAQYASTTLLCVGGDCRTSWPSSGTSFAYPFVKLATGENATSTIIEFNAGLISTASSTLASTTASGLLVTGSASTTNLFTNNLLLNGSSTLQAFSGTSGTTTNLATVNLISSASTTLASTTASGLLVTGSASTTNLFTNNLLLNGSSTFQKLFSTSATGTNLYATNFLALASSTLASSTISNLLIQTSATSSNFYANNLTILASSTIQALFSTSATGTNLYATNFLASASSSFQGLFSTSATGTNMYSTNFLANGSSTFQSFVGTSYLAIGSTTLQSFTASNSTTSQATTTNFFATTGNFGAASTDVINFKAGNFNFLSRATTTLQVTDTAWVIATNTAATAYPLMSFNNSAGTSTIQFFGATTTGLTAGTGVGIPTGQFVLIGDGKTPSGLNILKGGLCVDTDGWCTASTTGRISSVSSFIGNADLAEMYQAQEYVEPGDVIAVVSGISVAKATLGDKDKMMGVVSTKPGVVLGSGPDAEGRSGDVPIALTGRVPVKVSTENGAIKPGDYLTLSSTKGVGARATKAGAVIGQALESYSGSGVGKILVFVKNSYYSGLSLENFPGLTISHASTPEAILIALQNGAQTGSTVSSDLTVDRMLAAVEIVTPKLTAGLISAQKIESPTITALSNQIETEVSSLKSQIGTTNAALTSLEQRVTALESASSTSFSLAAVNEAVHNFMSATTEWVVSKITAVVGIFTKLCIGSTCIEEDQLKALLNQSGQSSSPVAPVSEPASPDPETQGDESVSPLEPELTPEPEPESEPASEVAEPPAPEVVPE